MAPIPVQQDKYVLAQSAEQVITAGQEGRLDLSLTTSVVIDVATIIGTVTDPTGKPIPGAQIKITDENHNGLGHTTTDEKGNYTISVPATQKPHCDVYCVAAGYLLGEAPGIIVLPRQTVTVNLTLTPDPNAASSLIAGNVFSPDGKPITNATVALLIVDPSTGTETQIGVAVTNEQGQYVFSNLAPGAYRLRFSAAGYVTAALIVNITGPRQVISADEVMAVSTVTSLGTIHGIIRDDKGAGIEAALVVLYSFDPVTGKLTPLQYTLTNDEGTYLFYGVAPGDYKVKATQKVFVES